jgi:hypothetical protein
MNYTFKLKSPHLKMLEHSHVQHLRKDNSVERLGNELATEETSVRVPAGVKIFSFP